jgi:hypothetical protein
MRRFAHLIPLAASLVLGVACTSAVESWSSLPVKIAPAARPAAVITDADEYTIENVNVLRLASVCDRAVLRADDTLLTDRGKQRASFEACFMVENDGVTRIYLQDRAVLYEVEGVRFALLAHEDGDAHLLRYDTAQLAWKWNEGEGFKGWMRLK